MNLRKMITITASATIIATSFSTISNIESNLIIVNADSKNEISNEQFDSDANAAAMAVSINKGNGFTVGDLDGLKADDGNRLSAYTDNDNKDSFAGLISGITNDYKDDDDDYEYPDSYNALIYLYNHFYNRFDSTTQGILSSYYKDTNIDNYCDLAMNLAEAIQNWGKQFDDVAPSPREIQENNAKEQENKAKKQARINRKNASNRKVKISRAKKNLKIAKSRYNKAKYNFKKHHSKKNKKSLSKANHNLKVAKSKYSALTK